MVRWRAGGLLVAVLAAAASGCTVDAPSLDDRACPCIEGWICDRDRAVCVRPDEADGGRDDAGVDAGGELDAATVLDAGADADAGDPCGCDDGIDCTQDYCVVAGECIHVADSARCSPGESCDEATGCVESTCTPPDCDDHDPCTGDTCDVETTECSHTDLCPGQLCCPGRGCAECCDLEDCEDGDPCTVDACAPEGCTRAAAGDGASCGVDLVCCGGACRQCCENADCDDGSACTEDTCVGGDCQSASICGCQLDADCMGAFCCAGTCRTCCDDPDCDDDDPCTLDSCENGRCLLRETCPGEECCDGACGECCLDGDCGPNGDCEAPPDCVGNACTYPPLADGTPCGPGGVCCGGGCDECCADENCPPPDMECRYHACVGDQWDRWCEDVPVDDGTACFWEAGSCCAGNCCTGEEICYAWYCVVPPVLFEEESNDTPATANRLQDGDRVGAELVPGDDVDWWVILLSAGDILTIDTLEACTTDTVVFVYAVMPPEPRPEDVTCDGGDPDALACNDDSGDWYCSRLTFEAPVGGHYYIRIVEFDYGDEGEYILQVWTE